MHRPTHRSCRLGSGLILVAVVLAGCQTYVPEKGLTLPSGRYLQHPPQYVQPGQPLPAPAAPPLQPAMAGQPVPAAALPAVRPALPPGKDTYVAELLDLLAQTKSVDAFLVTVELLAEEKTETRQIIPSVIRHAERLGIYGRHVLNEKAGTREFEVATRVTQLIEEMSKGKGRSKAQKDSTPERQPRANGSQPGKFFSNDPKDRMEKLLFESEDLRQIQDEWRRFWMTDQPSHLTYQRIHGGISADSSTPAALPQLQKTERIEEKISNDRATASVIQPPIAPGQRPCCAAPPTEAEVLRALPRFERGVPGICEVSRDEVKIVHEKLVDRIDPPRFFPLIGPAQLHHCHWKCTVHFTEVLSGAWPLPFAVKKRRSEVVYLDRDQLHLCAPKKLDGGMSKRSVRSAIVGALLGAAVGGLETLGQNTSDQKTTVNQSRPNASLPALAPGKAP